MTNSESFNKYADDLRFLQFELSKLNLANILHHKARYHNSCIYCWAPLNKQTRTKEHIIPHSRIKSLINERFSTILGNLNTAPCCESCNHAKGELTLAEYYYKLREDDRDTKFMDKICRLLR